MALKNITIPEETIKYGSGEITVRGISLSDLMTIVRAYGPQASMAFGKIQSAKSLDVMEVRQLIASVAQEFPDMVGAAMALAADAYDHENVRLMKKLPFNVQIEIIEKVFALTFSGEGDVKKLMESLTRVLTEVSGALTEVRLPSSIGIGAFAGQQTSA